jgi:hypothetical protein
MPGQVNTGRYENHDGILDDLDLSVSRNSRSATRQSRSERVRMSVRFRGPRETAGVFSVSLNSFTVLNHTTFMTYVGAQSSPLFGTPAAAQPLRRIQLRVKFRL